ncbi:hypothetical protein CLV70_107336 [Pseudosporangium ferrugineum]|uniref:Uncharacterized protein n=1 Tax=Pseudosporangium ferrugineum TaxID=439699 RepID=A0A2T0S6I6_9ACTN|nr:hypothetical protein CLV70_107336 [Pseudosporangium ferrugineum]
MAVLGGILLGAVDFALQKLLGYPWANLANSAAVWAVAAFALGYRVRGGVLRAAVAAIVLLVVAVPVYYVTATVWQDDNLANAWAPTALLWMFFGVLAGAVFGPAGVWARLAGWRGAVGLALPGAVLFTEAVRLARRGEAATAVLEAVLGIVVIAAAGRTWRKRAIGLAVAVPLALLGFVGYQVGGFA